MITTILKNINVILKLLISFHFMQITNIGILDKIYISVLSLLYFQTLTHSKNEQFWINGNTRITTQIILARWPHLMIILVPVSPRLIWRSDEIPKFYTYKAFSRYNAFSENMIRLWCKLLTGKKKHTKHSTSIFKLNKLLYDLL